ncbi:MAG: hypothetical protein ACUVRP_00680 [Chlorobiales bacterium]
MNLVGRILLLIAAIVSHTAYAQLPTIYLDFESDQDTTVNSLSDFLTGFVPKYEGARPERGHPSSVFSPISADDCSSEATNLHI